MKEVAIIDYGISNLLNVVRAFEKCGANVNVVDEPDSVINASRLVLPGVGAFSSGIKGLESRNLVDAIKEYSTRQRPFLGICLGMQLMLDESYEFGSHTGLGLIPGNVVEIPEKTTANVRQKIPHIGWNELVKSHKYSDWSQTILSCAQEGQATYFVHSYMAVPDTPEHRLADCIYGGHKISAVIKKDNLYGCQFHPEKSGKLGLKILEEFLAL